MSDDKPFIGIQWEDNGNYDDLTDYDLERYDAKYVKGECNNNCGRKLEWEDPDNYCAYIPPWGRGRI